MEEQKPPTVSPEEAAAFARRWGVRSLRPEHIAELQEAMTGIAQAGRNVPRVASKFDQPAAFFRVLSSAQKKWEPETAER
jgi:hypothetical protein